MSIKTQIKNKITAGINHPTTQKVKQETEKGILSLVYLVIGMAVLAGLFGNKEPREAVVPVHAEVNDIAQFDLKVPVVDQLEAPVATLATEPPVINQDQVWIDKINAYIQEYNPNLHTQGCGQADGSIWVEAGKKYKVHPYVLVAIARADTSLGKGLTSQCNLGNVGHCDSCATGYKYDTFANSIYSIAQTVANKYLSPATKTCHLSVGGWQFCPESKEIMNGKFYASSKVNWNRNVNDTMAWLHGEPYRNDFEVKI